MQQKNKKISYSFWHPAIITINLLIFLIFGNAINLGGIATAEEKAPADAGAASPTIDQTVVSTNRDDIDQEIGNKCQIALAKYADEEFSKYQNFMEDNFKNKSSTTFLMSKGMERYNLFKDEINQTYNQFFPQTLELAAKFGATGPNMGAALGKCETMKNQYIANAAKLLSMQAISTSNIKKTSVFVEKYKQINGKLENLNQDLLRVVNNMTSFERKVPCYVKTCI